MLCDRQKSVAEVCRRIGMNRQQFNKYLNGTTFPSNHNLRRICEFFRIDETEILLPGVEFAEIIGAGARTAADRDSPRFSVGGLADRYPGSGERLRRYLGFYFSHYPSPAYPGMVIRSAARIYERDGDCFERTIERLDDKSKPARQVTVCKYWGNAIHTDDRIYIAHLRSTVHQVLSLSILYPSHRRAITLLSGVFVSVSGGPGRQPFASRVVYEYLGPEPNLRKLVRACGIYPRDSAEISTAIRDRLQNDVPESHGVLSALAY